ncbi:MAG: hypothetical protein LJE67_11510 [Salaquimonas sp.]|nr:hypothetical protein [Salaquimonas sp.]
MRASFPDREPTPEELRRDHWQMLGFLALNAAIGVFAGIGVAAALIWLNIGGLGDRIAHASNPFLPILLITAPLALTFGAAAAASAIMMMPYKRKFGR